MTEESRPTAPSEAEGTDAGWRVRIIDLSGGAEDNIVEEIKGFHELSHAGAFARAYVRDSFEICRPAGARGREAVESWFSFGEDTEIPGAGEEGWRSASEIEFFADNPATPMERDWRSLDPRRFVEESVFLADEEDEDGE
ncbi:hypothetical protein LOC54_09885 [Acetobacter sp. AN02]|uniref:hypothetical protein n=1 Tax=Acetobacter sp. AN02 TaxID=2894186 RepID=UPI00243433C9|nr:hypothetical protein [Acetobacter sp. AN02]MDG6095408.1 hypothetical protein [Acetobacter sp. AN02]